MSELSIIILNYNTKDLVVDCLKSLEGIKNEVNFEIIVVDNASIDQSVEYIKKHFPKVRIIVNTQNLGFAKGNNSARSIVKTKYVLFLNSDTIVKPDVIKQTLNYLKQNSKIGAITCDVVLQSGSRDLDTRRSFPTPWVAFTHFSKLDRIFPTSKTFSKYWYGYRDANSIQEVDVIQGAFFLSPKKVLDEVGWFDEDYFLDGEDIDLCWKIKHKGYKIIYNPEVSIIHIKKGSKKKNKIAVARGVDAMEIFYKKRMWNKYPWIVNIFVIFGIRTMKLVRTI